MKTTNGKKRTRWVWVLVLILCLGIVGSGGGWLAWYYFTPQEDLSQFRSPRTRAAPLRIWTARALQISLTSPCRTTRWTFTVCGRSTRT